MYMTTAVSPDSIKAQGSRPAKLIYSWISICTSILERSLSLNAPSVADPSPSVPQSAESADVPQSAQSTAQDTLPQTPPEASPGPAETEEPRDGLASGSEKQDS